MVTKCVTIRNMRNRHYIARLMTRQADEGWSDERMARELGVSKSYWHYVARGRRQPGVGFLRRAMRRFPEYDLDVLFFLRADVREEHRDVPDEHPDD